MTIKKQIKIFVSLSLDNEGFLDIERVKSVIEYINSNLGESKRMSILRLYKRAIDNIALLQKVEIEYAGVLSLNTKEGLKIFLEREAGKKLRTIKESKNDDLLGGIRLTIGDTIYENSLRAEIEEFHKSLKKV